MFEKQGTFVRSLEAALDVEIDVQTRYLAALEQERELLPKFKTENLAELTAKRELISKEMAEAQLVRVELMRQFPEFRGKRLTDLVQLHCHPSDAKRLEDKIKRLKRAVATNRASGNEFGQVAQFTLNLVNGVLSLFWSATQNVTRSYTRKGKVRESYNTQGGRHSGVLKQA